MIPLVTSNPLGRLCIAQLVKALFISAITPAAAELVHRIGSAFISTTDELRSRESSSSIDLRRLQVDDRATAVVINAELTLLVGHQLLNPSGVYHNLVTSKHMSSNENSTTRTELTFYDAGLTLVGTTIIEGTLTSLACTHQMSDWLDNYIVFTRIRDESGTDKEYRYEVHPDAGVVTRYELSKDNPPNLNDVSRKNVQYSSGECELGDLSRAVYDNTVDGDETASVIFPTLQDLSGNVIKGRLIRSALPFDIGNLFFFLNGELLYTVTNERGLRVYQVPTERDESERFSNDPIFSEHDVFSGQVEGYRHILADLHPASLDGRSIDIYNLGNLRTDRSAANFAQPLILEARQQVLSHRVIATNDADHQYLLLQITDNDGQRKAVFVSIEDGNAQLQSARYLELDSNQKLMGSQINHLWRVTGDLTNQQIIESITIDLELLPSFLGIRGALDPTAQPTYQSITSQPSNKPITLEPSSEPTTSIPSFIPTTLAPSSRSTTMAPAIAPTTIAHPSRTTTSMPSVTPTAESPTLSQMLKDMITGQPSVAPLSDIPTVLTIIADTPTLQPIMDALVADGSSKKSRSLLTGLPLPYMLIIMTAASASICLILLCIKLVFVWNRDRDHQTGSIFSYLPPKQNNIPNPDTPEVPERLL